MSAATAHVAMQCFPQAYLDKADKIFLRPANRYTWLEIVSGAQVLSASGGSRQMSAVAQNTFRGFHKVNKNGPGAKEGFVSYFVENRSSLVRALSAVRIHADLHKLNNRICDDVRGRLGNIFPAQLRPYNKIRKPVDLYIEHLVAMAVEMDNVRGALLPLLFLPLDSWILRHPGLFSDGELAAHDLSRRSTYSRITSERTYSALQGLLVEKAETLAAKRRRPFHPIYFDLLWNCRYCNWGGNLFETNP